MKRWIYVLVPLAVLASLITWRLNQKHAADAVQQAQRTARAKAPPIVAVATASVRDIVHTYEGIGNVESPANVKISCKITGRIDFLQVQSGEPVKQGQVLVRIDPSEIVAQVNQQRAAAAEAQFRLTQAQITQNPTNVSVNTQISQQAAGLNSAQADYNQVVQNYKEQVASAQSAVTDAQGKVDSATAMVGNAEAAIRSAQANYDNATTHYSRYNDLYKQGYVAAQDVDDARTAMNVQKSSVDVANAQLRSAEAALNSAKAQLQATQNAARMVVNTGKANINDARAKEDQARAALVYARSNIAQKPAYVQNLAALRATVAAAQAQLKNAEAQLSSTVITSPINGFVTARYTDPGSVATPGQPILNLVILRKVWVTVPIPEEVSRRVYPGQPVNITFDAIPGRTFTGKISEINPSADPLSRQFAARIVLDNPQSLIKPGMFARITLSTERIPNAVVVPREAVQQGPDGTTVFVVNADGKVEQRSVTLGASDTNNDQVTQGVQPGEKVVTLSAIPLKEGQAVRVGGEGGHSGSNRTGGHRS